MPRPDIAILNPVAHLGGAEMSLLELISRLQEFYCFHLILPGDGPLRKRAEGAGASVHVLPLPGAIARAGEVGKRTGLFRVARSTFAVRSFTKVLSKMLHSLQPQTLITNGVKSHILGALAANGQVPLVWYMRESQQERPVSRNLLRMLSSRCRLAICISRYVADEMYAQVSHSLRLRVVYNIVDLDRFRPNLPLPSDLEKSPGEIWFGVVGPITSLKGQDLFLQAAHRLKRLVPQARFLIVGSNFYATEKQNGFEPRLHVLARELSLENETQFLGFREDVANIMANLDVLVQPNRGPEGLGRSVLEAMACAVPVISVDRWGPGEIVQDRITGLQFPAGNVEALAACMLELAQDPASCRRLGENSRGWVEENLRPECLTSAFRAVIEEVLC